MKRQHSFAAFGLALVALSATWVSAQTEPDRTVLPLAERTYPPITEIDVRKATPPRCCVGPTNAPGEAYQYLKLDALNACMIAHRERA